MCIYIYIYIQALDSVQPTGAVGPGRARIVPVTLCLTLLE